MRLCAFAAKISYETITIIEKYNKYNKDQSYKLKNKFIYRITTMANNYCKTNIQYVSDAQKRVEKKTYTQLLVPLLKVHNIFHILCLKKNA